MRLDLLGQLVVASGDSSSGDPRLFGLALFLSGFVFYGAMYARYRNTDKRHRHESETEARMLDVRAVDQHVDTQKGVKHSRMKGANNTEVRGASRGLLERGMPDAVNSALRNLPGGGRLQG